MEFQVPQFIERKPKIIGPLTFGQFVYIAIAGAIFFILYYSIAETNFLLFLFISIIVFLTAFAFAFGKIGGRSLPVVLINFFEFCLAPKRYFWGKKEVPLKLIMKKIERKEGREEAEEIPLKIAERNQLKKLSTQIETGMK